MLGSYTRVFTVFVNTPSNSSPTHSQTKIVGTLKPDAVFFRLVLPLSLSKLFIAVQSANLIHQHWGDMETQKCPNNFDWDCSNLVPRVSWHFCQRADTRKDSWYDGVFLTRERNHLALVHMLQFKTEIKMTFLKKARLDSFSFKHDQKDHNFFKENLIIFIGFQQNEL